ncbi:MAG TPA: hypothetical protein PLR30_09300 [Saprospiraceae bacterium]|nr:hypothetical protein [Saprospiraceae bacterium]
MSIHFPIVGLNYLMGFPGVWLVIQPMLDGEEFPIPNDWSYFSSTLM